jgi:SEC-C motif-containing protein
MPATALLLMRSRYAGYALGLADYIIETTHHSNPSCQLFRERWRKEIVAFSKNTAFEGLTIVEVIEGFDTAR